MANTVEELYTQVLGRAPDAEGLAYWKNAFGGSVDSNEQASFMQAVQSALANKTPAEQTALAPNLFNGVTTGNTVAPTVVNALGGPVQKLPPAPTDTNQNPLVKLYQDTLGRTPSQAEIDKWNFGSTIDAGELDKFLGFARNEATSTLPTTGAAANIAKQILAQGTTSKWSGEGYGSTTKTAYDMGVMLAGQGLTDINQLGQAKKEVQSTDSEGNPTTETVTQFINKATGQPLNTYYDKAATIGPNIWGGTFAGKDSTAYGVQFDPTGKPIFYSQYGGDSSSIGDLMPLIQIGLLATGAGGMLGNAILGAGASQVAAGALGGGLIGGATSALTGGDFLKGAALGAAGGAIAGYFSPSTGQVTAQPTADSVPVSYNDLGIDYSLANGTQMNPLTDMGGAGGLQPGTSANLDVMGGGQGITLNLGAPSTTLANALSTFGGANPANITDMGGGQGLTYQTPSGLVTQGGTILTGGSTGNNNVIGETGVNTATNIGGDLGKTLAGVNTGVYDPTAGMLTSGVVNSTSSGLTASQIANLAKAGISVAGLLGGAAVAGGVGGGGTGGVGGLPTQGVPLNSQDYFNAIQQNYNALLPAVPRDVATPLAQWYNSAYGGGTTPVTNVTPITPQTASGGMFSTSTTANPLINPPALVSPQASTGIPPAPTTAAMSPQQSAQTIQEMPTATSVNTSELSPAQKAYADYLSTQQGQGSASDISGYVKGLNDYQSLMSLANMQGKVGSGEIYNGTDGFRTMKELSALYGVPITNYGQ